jgi:predicted ATPase
VNEGEAVVSSISGALGIAPRSDQTPEQRLLDALGPQDALIVLDNCEHLLDACAQVTAAVLRQCPRVHLIATSREPLGIAGETIFRVPSLSLPESDASAERSDAVELFMTRARAQGAAFALDDETAPQIVSICRRLDGMPLAIELAAARLRSMSPASLAERLDQRFRLLTGGSRGALPRQQTLQATVQWSYSLLSDGEQTLLRRLSVFVDGFTLEAAEAICGLEDIDAVEIADLLGSLVDKSLVVAEPLAETLRYRLLETIRQFAAERLIDSGEEAAHALAAAHCRYFCAFVEAADEELMGPEQRHWIARLDADQANLLRALELAAGDPATTELGLRLASGSLRYWWIRRPPEQRDILLSLLDRPESLAVDPRVRSRALVGATRALTFVDIARSRDLGEQAVDLARAIGDERWLVEALAALCAADVLGGEPERAIARGEEAAARARELANDGLLAQALAVLILAVRDVDPDRTAQLQPEAIARSESSGNHVMLALLHNMAGTDALPTGDYARVTDHLRAAEEAWESIGVQMPNAKITLAAVAAKTGDRDGAIALLDAALRLARRTGEPYGLAYVALASALIAEEDADWPAAARLHGIAQAFIERIGQMWASGYKWLRDPSIENVRAQLGDEEFEHLYSAGRNLPVDASLQILGAAADGR